MPIGFIQPILLATGIVDSVLAIHQNNVINRIFQNNSKKTLKSKVFNKIYDRSKKLRNNNYQIFFIIFKNKINSRCKLTV